jgi:hypothetical protein
VLHDDISPIRRHGIAALARRTSTHNTVERQTRQGCRIDQLDHGELWEPYSRLRRTWLRPGRKLASQPSEPWRGYPCIVVCSNS